MTETVLPSLRPELRLYPSAPNTDGSATWVIYDPIAHRYFNIGRLEFELLRRWQGRSADQLLTEINQETSLRVSGDTLKLLLNFLDKQQLLQLRNTKQLLQRAAAVKKFWFAALLQNYLFFRVPLVRPDHFLSATLPALRFLFTPTFRNIVIFIGILGIYLISRQFSTFIHTFPYFFTLEGAITFAIALSFAKIIHELGHAYTAKYYGVKVPTMGVALLVLWPVLYTDTTDAWKLTSRHQRLRIDAAGIIAELGLAAFATLLWNFLPDSPLRSAIFMLAAVTWGMTLLVNLSPFMRFDGYYLLSDFLGIKNLQERSFALGKWWLRELFFGFGDPPPELHQQRVMLIYAYSTWIYRLFLFLGIALVVYYFFFKVAGIFLLIVEVIWFVVRPIYREIQYWLTRWKEMRLNWHTLFFLTLLTGLIALLVIPWQSTIRVPAVYRFQENQVIHAPIAAQLQTVHAKRGKQVQTGDLLFVLEDSNIAHNLQAAQRRVDLLKLQLELQAADPLYLESTHILRNQLLETVAELKGYQAQQDRLNITAPFSGKIVEVANDLRVGRWVNPHLALASLVDDHSVKIVAYISEDNLSNIAVGTSGRFYPAQLDQSIFEVRVKAIDSTNIPHLQLNDYYVASIYQGKVAVRPASQDKLVPHEAIYRVELAVQGEVNYLPEQVFQGTVVLEVLAKRSLIQRFWQLVYTVLIRESGF